MRSGLTAALMKVYPIDALDTPAAWPRCALLTPHVLACCETNTAKVESSALLTRAAGYFLARAAFSEGRPLLEQALAIDEKVLGPEHPDIATNLSNLGRLLYDQGDFATAQSLFERALAIRAKVLGPEDPGTAASFQTLRRCSSPNATSREHVHSTSGRCRSKRK
jgi:tetratricopeptide (TPR) repeat protein